MNTLREIEFPEFYIVCSCSTILFKKSREFQFHEIIFLGFLNIFIIFPFFSFDSHTKK